MDLYFHAPISLSLLGDALAVNGMERELGQLLGVYAGAFPQVRWVVAAESGTGALIGATIGAYTVGEQTLARDLLPALGAGMLVLADRNFLSHTLARDVLATGAHLLWRASASFKLTPTAVLGD